MSDFVVKNGLQIGGGSSLKSGTIAGNATLDLTSGNFFSHTPTADTTFVFSNPPASGKAHGFALKVTGVSVAAGYDLANASYDSVSFSVSSQEVTPYGMAFSADGTKMYMCGASNSTIYQYSLSTAFDLSTASYNSVSFTLSTGESQPFDVYFNTDGTKMYVLGDVFDYVFQYSLSAAFDVSTASYDSVSFNVSSQDNRPMALAFNTQGTKMYMCGRQNDSVYQYTLSTAFDLSTASYDSVSFSFASQDANPFGLTFNNDGTKMYMCGTQFDNVHQYTLSTAFDLSTASYDSVSFSVSSQDVDPYKVLFSNSGTKMYMLGTANAAVFQYSTAGTPAPATFTYPASVAWPNGTPPTAPSVGETDVLTFYTEDGGTTYNGFQAGDAMQ